MRFFKNSRFYVNQSIIEISESSLNIISICNKKNYKIIFAMVFNLNHKHFIFNLQYEHKYVHIFHQCSNSLADLLM